MVVLGFLYYRMVKREVPTPVDRNQAILPILIGLISLPISVAFALGVNAIAGKLGYDGEAIGPMLHSITGAFFSAGLPEEIGKLLMMLLSIYLFRKRIRNVYEYILVGAATGFGFTLVEEALYNTSSGILMAGRLITVAGHMVYGIIMAKHLGLGRFQKENGGHAAGEYIKALLIPIVLHTFYDTCTALNFLLNSEVEATENLGMLLSLVGLIAMFVIQVVVLISAKKNTAKYCDMELRTAA